MTRPAKGPAAPSHPPFTDEERALRGSLFRVRPLVAVAVGGAAGGLIRTALAEISSGWPWPTLLVNISGAFLLGLVVMYGRRHWPGALIAGVAVGGLGAFTTFSTMTGELWEFFDAGEWGTLALYGLASVVGGILAAVTGVRLGRTVR